MRQDVMFAEPTHQLRMITSFLSEQLSTVLRTPVDKIDPDENLNHLGIDSLMAVELRNHVKARLDIVIPIAELLQNPSITRLSEAVLEQLIAKEIPASPQQIGSGGERTDGNGTEGYAVSQTGYSSYATTEQTQDHLDNLSDAEVDFMLSRLRNKLPAGGSKKSS
jgi:acyl carrier protein